MSNTPWKNFSKAELECQCRRCTYTADQMDSDLMYLVQSWRSILGFSFPVNSAIRCNQHNANIGSRSQIHTPHTINGETRFHAIDIGLNRQHAWDLLELARQDSRIVGIGMKMHGNNSGRFIHLDTHPSRNGKRREWTYR